MLEEAAMRLTITIGALLLAWAGPVLAQNGAAGPSVSFGQVTGIPIPLQSVSGRFSSLNPPGRHDCPDKKASGRVVSPTLILVPNGACGRRGQNYALVNVQFRNPAEAVQMIPGRRVDITADFERAFEARASIFTADYVIAEKAMFAGGDPVDRSAPPTPPFTSYMICQPPELDTLAGELGSDLCVQNTLLADLKATGPALAAAARAPSKVPPEDIASGDIVAGDANAIACGLDPKVSDRHLTAIACARESYWTWVAAIRDPKFSTPAPP
jgi:hypothetical protein